MPGSNDELRKKFVNIISQNVRGFNHEKEEELIVRLRERNVFAACLQETWRTRKASWENNGFVFLHNGLEQKPCARGAQGVAIVLGPEARLAWEKNGCQRLHFGTRIVATRLQIYNGLNRPLTIFLMSAYAPDSGRPFEEHEEFEIQKQLCYEAVKAREILVEGTDANASIGVRSSGRSYLDIREESDRDRVVGPFGVQNLNAAGKGLLQVLGMNQLCAPMSFFRKTVHGLPQSFAYATWRHPGRRSLFQLDYFFMKQKDLKRVRDAGVWKYGVDSDHRAIFLRLEIAHTLAEPRALCSKRVDRSLLQNPEVRAAWREAVTESVGMLRGSKNSDGGEATSLQVLEGAMQMAAKKSAHE